MDLQKINKIYFIGIKGAGMTALAQIFKYWGKEVLGSDVADKFFTDEVLARSNIKVIEKFAAENIMDDIDLVVYSTAYNDFHIEVAEAKKRGLKILSYPEVLGLLFDGKYGISVCGTHGKTTTTAMLGYVLQELGEDPTVIVGTEVPQLGGNARAGQGKYLVVESDEYQNKLQYYNPQAVILTSADYDHPDYFKSHEEYKQVFYNFVARIPADGILVAFAGDENVREIVQGAKCRVVWHGEKSQTLRLRRGFGGQAMTNDQKNDLKLKIPGEHNVWNAMAVLTLIQELGLDVEKAKKILANFEGGKRRFELVGDVNGIKIYDDYAHHSAEVQKLLQGARERFPKNKIWCVFQPHTFTRTAALFDEFAQSFKLADEVIIMDIFASAREEMKPEFEGLAGRLVEEIKKYSPSVRQIGIIEEAVDCLSKNVKSGDVVFVVGAGENWKVGEGLVRKLKLSEP